MRKNFNTPTTETAKLATGGRLRKVRNIHRTKAGQKRGTIQLSGTDRDVFFCAKGWHLSRPIV